MRLGADRDQMNRAPVLGISCDFSDRPVDFKSTVPFAISHRVFWGWWARLDSNQRPMDYEPDRTPESEPHLMWETDHLILPQKPGHDMCENLRG